MPPRPRASSAGSQPSPISQISSAPHGPGTSDMRLQAARFPAFGGKTRRTPEMCGINGIYAYHYAANPVDRAELLRTRDRMAARGPDGKGEWVSQDGRAAFAHRRLSIIDLSDAAAQPMVSADGSLIVILNGEIYNYRALRNDLEVMGRTFRSHSDTEVLLHLYAVKGEAMVHDLRGMFAFAIWDA